MSGVPSKAWDLSFVTGSENFFEDFVVGTVFDHARGRTIDNVDNLWITHTTLNTAEAHFNLPYAHGLMDGRFEERLVMGAVTIAVVIGLTSEDLSENAIADVGLTGVRLHNPVFEGDTLHARSEILELAPDSKREDAGLLTYRFEGRKGDDIPVVEGVRTVSIKRRPVRTTEGSH
ncbi:MaoC family dehydratase [Williamsia muralis]|uniref:Acyl dehydratase n=1 Tax=Williamsia marianensis TaxID=85044 RepID=A0A2G3PQ00_WILMA|nr:MaoC family dehydratase [Williamsia marianensis]PHV67152.1 acyl dehydratase [Williamsia marianensis]